MAEDLTDYMKEIGIRVRYLHSDIDTLERTEIIRDMRLNVFDVLVGINLLREGLDIPEITWLPFWMRIKRDFCVRRLHGADDRPCSTKCGRSCDHVCGCNDRFDESGNRGNERRRTIQEKYNKEHNITPRASRKRFAI